MLCTLASSTALLAQAAPPALEQITVTAKKRSQDMRNVDISMSVVDEETVQALQIRALPEIANMVENVQMFEDFAGAGIPTWIIRGVGLQDFNTNNTPTASVYVDDSYQVATVMGGSTLFDIERIEVLKGPQGGLYGRNTSGGAVRLDTRRAQLGESGGYLNAGYGRWDQATLEAATNVPLGDTLAMRVAGRGEHSNDGWQRSIPTGQVHGDKDRWDLRTWFVFEPVDSLSVQWKVQGGSDDSDIPLGRSIGIYANGATATLCQPILAGRRDDDACLNAGGVNRVKAGQLPERISSQAADGSAVLSQPLNRQYNDYLSSVLDIAWQFAAVELRSISSYDNFGYGVMLDLDGSDGEYGHRNSASDIAAFSQEFRLLSTTDDAFQWLVGASLSKEDFEETRAFDLRQNTLVPLGRGRLTYDQNTDSAAAFADLSYRLADDWTLNGSARYTSEEKEYRNGNFYIPSTTPTYFARGLASDYKLGSRLAGSASLNWTPGDATLAYAKLSRGFKSGGVFGGFPFYPVDVVPYDEETINAIEVGVKQTFPERAMQVNAAVFHYEYANVQGFVQVLNPVTGTGIDGLTNQGDARHDGAEVQLQWTPLTRLDFDLGLAYLDARFVSTGQTTMNILGDLVEITGQRPYAPRWSANALVQYQQNVASGTVVDWTVAWNYRTEFAGYQSTPADAAINYLPGYGLVNLGVNLSRQGQPWKAGLWVRNALDKVYRTRVKSDGLRSFIEMFGEPRSVGVDIHYQF